MLLPSNFVCTYSLFTYSALSFLILFLRGLTAMIPEKETFMVLTVDLECNRCFTKVKRALCSLPQVRDQIYKEKENAVVIKVVGCCRERIRDKLCDKCGKSIKFIEILEKKKPPVNTTKVTQPDKQTQATPAEITPPVTDAGKSKKTLKTVTFDLEEHPAKAEKAPPAAEAPKPAERAAMMAPMVPASVYGYGYPVNGSGYGYGCGYGVPPPPPPAGGYGYGYGYGYKPGPPGYCGDYISNENASGCRLM